MTSDLGGGESDVAAGDQRSECAHGPGSGAVAVGIGVRPGTESARIVHAVEAVAGKTPIACLATLDRRASEPGVRAAAAALGVALVGFTAEQLSGVDVEYDSGRTAAAVGTPSVAEAAALLASGGEIVFGRTIVDGIVVAAARMSPRTAGDRSAPN
ncbi:cobalamin biosynthesis protein [Nocardia sp. NPDC058176]|uniref:cobalamin biosynthesis protein n=1 Tax=Nocardia sp. NPDC058176 TaxID=3346368 RepID=UPI0036DDA354